MRHRSIGPMAHWPIEVDPGWVIDWVTHNGGVLTRPTLTQELKRD